MQNLSSDLLLTDAARGGLGVDHRQAFSADLGAQVLHLDGHGDPQKKSPSRLWNDPGIRAGGADQEENDDKLSCNFWDAQVREALGKEPLPSLRDALGAPLGDCGGGNLAELGDGGGAAECVDSGVCVHSAKLSTLSLSASSKLRVFSRTLKPMSARNLVERLALVQTHLGDETQVALYRASGASSSVVNQWFSGSIKSIHPRFAFKIQADTGISAEWLILGTGPMMLRGNMVEVSAEEFELLAILRQLPEIYRVAAVSDVKKYRDLAAGREPGAAEIGEPSRPGIIAH